MSVVTTKYLGKARVTSTYNKTHETITTDAGTQAGGYGEHANPVEILCTALAACALTVMGLNAEKSGASFAGCYAEVDDYEEDTTTFVVTRIAITFHLKAEFDEKLRKKLEAFSHRACFVGNSLKTEKDFTYIYDL
ncbi:OsmC family protein [Prevotella sp. kh1p2]|uniref:OsmC family protein n=1 Tax=Prevotella sp. kh1p2 TaxID=1761883 RepID=UPI0008C48CFF|nr:OsmC family protein [Prevotella sp. kh1p2]SET02863.1 Uncharacterized OsmC-related protein [Prevotella sp. kh1p2]SNU11435.1 Uncharacterized OsmC-related protein [Prevotellaceae bacterium KH2P17]